MTKTTDERREDIEPPKPIFMQPATIALDWRLAWPVYFMLLWNVFILLAVIIP